MLFAITLLLCFFSRHIPVTQASQSNAVSSPASKLTTMVENVAERMKRQLQMREALKRSQDEWRTPIEFYGKVVDENDDAVANVAISFGCNDLSHDGHSTYQRMSDGQGSFSIKGIAGKLLTVQLSKEGYYASKRDNDSFYYAGQNVNFVPNQTNPVIFHLRKKKPGESSIVTDFPGFAKIAQLHRDGSPVGIDLVNGIKVAAGDGQIDLELWQDAADKKVNVFNWKCRVSVPGGGIVETQEEFAFQAPESGYQPSILIDMPTTIENWQTEIRRKYYIKLPKGNYGEIDFYLLAYNGAYTIHSVINPSGSRNLEPQSQ